MTTIIRSRKANEQKTTGITKQQLILDYGTFTFSTLDKRDIATWRQWDIHIYIYIHIHKYIIYMKNKETKKKENKEPRMIVI